MNESTIKDILKESILNKDSIEEYGDISQGTHRSS
jgi:hypothetical protein